ncbi:MAG: Gfo/Idh/MocA family oxidoreductase [Candidatus Dormibacteraeota bacterium]|nr:Gfo/Idh/MocA family oxidoreductase [Candidatus Dormibacteraeota bacterium]
MGAAGIADRAVLPALNAAGNARAFAIAARTPERAANLAARHGIERVHPTYEALLADPEIDAVYVPLPNHLHAPWTLRALAAGKHVLCEKPLALDAAEAGGLAAAARSAGRLLMEAAMYRFHPRMRGLAATVRDIRYMSAAFAFTIHDPDNYRLRPEMGGGALLDVGFYTADLAVWLLGEPERVEAVLRADAVVMSASAVLAYPRAQAALYSSFEAPEFQELVLVTGAEVLRVDRPFTSRFDPDDPYRLMLEAFGDAILAGTREPHPIEASLATARTLDRIRQAAGAV